MLELLGLTVYMESEIKDCAALAGHSPHQGSCLIGSVSTPKDR